MGKGQGLQVLRWHGTVRGGRCCRRWARQACAWVQGNQTGQCAPPRLSQPPPPPAPPQLQPLVVGAPAPAVGLGAVKAQHLAHTQLDGLAPYAGRQRHHGGVGGQQLGLGSRQDVQHALPDAPRVKHLRRAWGESWPSTRQYSRTVPPALLAPHACTHLVHQQVGAARQVRRRAIRLAQHIQPARIPAGHS